MLLICIFQSWSVDKVVSRTDEAEQEGEASTDAQRGGEGSPESVGLQLPGLANVQLREVSGTYRSLERIGNQLQNLLSGREIWIGGKGRLSRVDCLNGRHGGLSGFLSLGRRI